MDLSFSPDLPAWICYLVVLFFGVLAGWREVIAQLRDTFVIWRYPAAWALVFILAVGPVLLFWLLDRVGALHDTSLIAAAIVGIAYTQIIKGDAQYKAPGETSPFWNFLSWWRDRVAKTVQDRVGSNRRTFDQIVCSFLAAPTKAGTPATPAPAGQPPRTPLEEVTAIALKHAADPADLRARIDAERRRLEGVTPALAADVVDFKVAEFVYREMIRTDEPGYRKLLVTEGLIPSWLVDKYFGSRRGRLFVGFAFPTVVVALLLAVLFDRTGAVTYLEREYLISRLNKQSGTANDLDRVTARLIRLVAEEQRTAAGKSVVADFWLLPLMNVLNDSTLHMSRIDATLRVFLAARDKNMIDQRLLAELLLMTLRSANVDVRQRVHLGLVYLSPESKLDKEKDKEKISAAFKSLSAWNPTAGDSTTEIEAKIDEWRSYWMAMPK